MKQAFSHFIKIHQNGFRLLKVTRQLDRNLIPLSLLQAILSAVLPYISILLSARVIDLLLAGSYRQAAYYALIMVSASFLTAVTLSILRYYTNVGRRMCQEHLAVLLREKAMELDYTTMEDPETIKALKNAEEATRYSGGLSYLVRVYQEFLQYTLSLIAAVVLTVSFCLTPPGRLTKIADANAFLTFFTHPVVTAGALIVAWICGLLLTKKQSTAIRRIEDNIAEKHYQAEAVFGYWAMDVISNLESEKTIRVNHMTDLVDTNRADSFAQIKPFYRSMGTSDTLKALSEGLETGLFSVAAYLLVILKILANAISIGSFTKYTGALIQFNTSCSKLIWAENNIQRTVKNMLPMADFLDRNNQMETGSLHVEKRNDHYMEIEFHDVGFRYPGAEQFSLRHVNLKLTPKQKLAVVGPNGAGKTTFIKLLCRLYDPTEGSITLNGIDIRKYSYQQYLTLFGVVFQNFHLFGFPIAENVAASHTYESTRVRACLEQAGVWEFTSGLPKGMETIIENGDEQAVDVSGGQAQKIAIARALYKDAPFVILDEPTAALDPISEAEIYERFHEMVLDKSSIYISHRMSSCRFCDEIAVFDKGEIQEQGSHEELLKKGGLYYKLWTAQAQYYE